MTLSGATHRRRYVISLGLAYLVPPGNPQLRGSRDIYFPMNTSLQLSTQTRTARMTADLRQTLHLRAGKSRSQRISIGLSSAQPTARISFKKHSKNLIPAPSVPVDATFVRHYHTDTSTDGGAQ